MSIKDKSLEIEAKLKTIENFKSVDLLSGHLDEDEYRGIAKRLPGILLTIDDTPLEKLDHEYSMTTMFKAILLHSNKSSRKKQVTEMFDLIQETITKLKELRDITVINFAPIENSKALIAFEVNFKYMERI